MLVSSFVLLAAAGASGVVGTVLDKRAADTSAICLPAYSWTDNSANISPCRLASIVSATCHGSSWNVPPLVKIPDTYTPPNAANGTLETCSCSWIAYNLFSACGACQGFEGTNYAWGQWKQNCDSNNITTGTFPIPVLPDGTQIPYYAVTDPTTWENQRWNSNQAQSIARENHPDVTQTTTTTKKKSTPVGPIVGGVIGGLAALLIAGGIAFWIHSKKKKGTTRAPTAPSVSSEGMTTLGYGSPQGHMRQISDMSNKSIGLGYQNLGNSFVTSSITNTRGPASPTSMHTHTGSVNSLSYFGSVQNSVAPYATTASPPPATLSSPVPPVPALPPAQAGEHVITPFTLVPSQSTRTTSPNSGYPSDRKRADGAIIPVYDSPNSLPSDIGGGGGRARFNPPAYTDYTAGQPFDSASQAPSRPIHTKKGSADTVTTIASPISPISPISPVTQGTGVNTHISGLDDTIGQLGLNGGNGTNLGAPTVSGTGGTLATGQSMGMNPVQGSRQQGPFRPTNVHDEEPEI